MAIGMLWELIYNLASPLILIWRKVYGVFAPRQILRVASGLDFARRRK